MFNGEDGLTVTDEESECFEEDEKMIVESSLKKPSDR